VSVVLCCVVCFLVFVVAKVHRQPAEFYTVPSNDPPKRQEQPPPGISFEEFRDVGCALVCVVCVCVGRCACVGLFGVVTVRV